VPPSRARAIPFPGYVAKRPQYRTYQNLRLAAGLQDTLINLSEVALRYFERDLATQSNPRGFVDEVSDELGVNTSFGASWADVRMNAHRYAVAQAYAVFDNYCRQLGKEYRAFHPDWKWRAQIDDRTLDALTALTENMAQADRRYARECPEYDLLHYYRAVRNRLLHATAEDTDALRLTLIGKHEQHYIQAYGTIPTTYANIGYSDYSSLTRAMKYYAAVLNDGCALSPDTVVSHYLADGDFLAALRRRKGDVKKIQKLARALARRYAIGEGAIPTMYERLDEFVAADPSRRVRRAAGGKKASRR
jgi:hypothetical protein